MGPVCFSCGDGGHRINRRPQVNADFPFLPAGWSVNMVNGQYRATRMNKTLTEVPGNEQWSEREGQSLGPPEIKAPLTQVGVSVEISNGNPIGGYRRNIVSGATGRPIVRSSVLGNTAEDGRKDKEIARSQCRRSGPATDGLPDAGSPEFGPGDATGSRLSAGPSE